VMSCWHGYLSGMSCRLFAYGPADATAIPKPHRLLPQLITFSVLAYPGFPGKDAIMWVYSSCMVVVPTAWTAGFTAEVLQH